MTAGPGGRYSKGRHMRSPKSPGPCGTARHVGGQKGAVRKALSGVTAIQVRQRRSALRQRLMLSRVRR